MNLGNESGADARACLREAAQVLPADAERWTVEAALALAAGEGLDRAEGALREASARAPAPGSAAHLELERLRAEIALDHDALDEATAAAARLRALARGDARPARGVRPRPPRTRVSVPTGAGPPAPTVS